ncbi:hypothetical protein [Nocardia goodfellowii]|uniref:Uncharacterized protein n=1 Tax=Nocardia goodfellowii TaxID=882446 RepID=A0ABS4QR00_9NOCA|nr:hypothetical protein [Nocardia goodfellowii]MBP2193595.1 hypothetical protein [Nocardia goodfellowii]
MSIVPGRSATSSTRKSRQGRKSHPDSVSRDERAVDPDGLLSPEERAWRAEQLRAQRKIARLSRRTGVA